MKVTGSADMKSSSATTSYLLICTYLFCLKQYCTSHLVPRNAVKDLPLSSGKNIVAAITAGSLLLTSFPTVSNGVSLGAKECDNPTYKKNIFNIPPGPIVFPAYFEGTWDTTFRFEDAKFTDQFTMKELSTDVNVAGFRKYGVAYMPDIGANFECDLRYTDQSSRILEDRNFNLRSILQSATQASVDEIEYDLNKDANRCSVKYHDSKGSGKQELFTNYRKQETLPDGTFRTVENIRQSTVRVKIQQRASQTIVDYGLEWNFLMTGPGLISGSLKIISYLMPQDNLYFTRPEKPVGIFLYNLKMSKK